MSLFNRRDRGFPQDTKQETVPLANLDLQSTRVGDVLMASNVVRTRQDELADQAGLLEVMNLIASDSFLSNRLAERPKEAISLPFPAATVSNLLKEVGLERPIPAAETIKTLGWTMEVSNYQGKPNGYMERTQGAGFNLVTILDVDGSHVRFPLSLEVDMAQCMFMPGSKQPLRPDRIKVSAGEEQLAAKIDIYGREAQHLLIAGISFLELAQVPSIGFALDQITSRQLSQESSA